MSQVENFIGRWQGADGSELANAQSFTRELCELLKVPVPDPARADTRDNAYVFERRVIFSSPDGSTSEGRIDCFKRGAFVLESKKLKQGWSELAPFMAIVNGNAPATEKSREDVKRELEEALLEKLVALNSARAEEEKQGIIHWLRPEYQNSQGAANASKAVTAQTELAIDDEAETPVAIAATKQPWPKGDLEQVKAIADLIANSKSPLSLESVATCFSGKGQWKKRLPNILDMLVIVGKARVDERGYVAV